MTNRQHLRDKTVFITGGSGDLGKEIAKAMVARGAHVIIFARRHGPLDEARKEIVAAKQETKQEVRAVSLDLGDASEVDVIFRSQTRLPDLLFCVAGGCTKECGFLTDVNAEQLENCMRKNYFTAAYAAQSVFKMWVEDDRKATTKNPRLRQMVFISSAAAFLGLPGYTAYTPSKCAVRALADTLRMEALRLSGPVSTYTIRCAFPSNFISQAFTEEQKMKPDLTKRMEGTLGSIAELEKRFPSAEEVAQGIIKGVGSDDFAICNDSNEAALLFTNMIGPSPKRGLGIIDSFLATVLGLIVWPIVRHRWDRMCKGDRGQAGIGDATG